MPTSSPPDLPTMSPAMARSEYLMVPAHQSMSPPVYSPPSSTDEGMTRSHSISRLSMMGIDVAAPAQADLGMPSEMYSYIMPWTSANDMAPQYVDSSASNASLGHGRSHSYDSNAVAPSMPSWIEPNNTVDMYYAPAQHLPTPSSGPGNYFPSPATTPHHPSTPRPMPSQIEPVNTIDQCTCFTACIQSLQTLHNISAPPLPAFGMILSINRKAVESCALMLDCGRCIGRSGTHMAAMLLATLIGKITSVYRDTFHMYFENGYVPTSGSPNSFDVNVGGYTLNGNDSRWLELEVLGREFRKLEEVYAHFRDVCVNLSEDPEVSKAMIDYLSRSLSSTLEVIQHSKDMAYA